MRRPRSFWESRISELAQGRSVERVARQHGVTPARLRWWRWRLATSSTTAMVPTRMVEILPGPPAVTVASIRILVGDVVIELPPTMMPVDVGRVARAICTPC